MTRRELRTGLVSCEWPDIVWAICHGGKSLGPCAGVLTKILQDPHAATVKGMGTTAHSIKHRLPGFLGQTVLFIARTLAPLYLKPSSLFSHINKLICSSGHNESRR